MQENLLAKMVVQAAFETHSEFGPGLMEHVYECILSHKLREMGLKIQTQLDMPVWYKGIKMDVGYRLDLLVEDKLIVEIKSISQLGPVHFKQTLTYLRLSDKRLGLLINFNEKLLKDGIHRVVNQLLD